MEHGLKDIAFYVQKHITPCTVVITSLLVHDKPLGAPASVKRVYTVSLIICWNTFKTSLTMFDTDNDWSMFSHHANNKQFTYFIPPISTIILFFYHSTLSPHLLHSLSVGRWPTLVTDFCSLHECWRHVQGPAMEWYNEHIRAILFERHLIWLVHQLLILFYDEGIITDPHHCPIVWQRMWLHCKDVPVMLNVSSQDFIFMHSSPPTPV